jgi:uncharacterized membrane protein
MFLHLFTKQRTELKLALRQWLFISCCFSCFLVFIRIVATGHLTYLFLFWNLFLAFVPYAISERFFGRAGVIANKWKRIVLFFCWLLFIPNSFYIITDFFHLDQFDSAPKWFDLLLLFSFAWNGLLLGILSVRRIELMLTAIGGQRLAFLFVLVVMWLNAFGVYIGRYLRYNSWDIILQPFSLFGEMFQVLVHPLQNKMEWGMITTWAAFMTLFYITIKKLGESFISPGHSIKN